MSQLNDAIVSVVGPQINDGLLTHYQANGATSLELQDAEYEFLIAGGATPAQINDMWFEALRAAGFVGELNDMLLPFWLSGGTFAPPAPPAFDGTIPNDSICETVLWTYDAKQNFSTGGYISQWSLTNNPPGMSISNTGIIRWTPAVGDPDAVGVTVTGNNATGPAATSNAFNVVAENLPQFVSAEVATDGLKLSITFDVNVTNFDGFTLRANGVVVPLSGGANNLTEITFTTAQVFDDETLTLSYAPGNVVASSNGCALAAFTDQPVTNSSTVPRAFVEFSPQSQYGEDGGLVTFSVKAAGANLSYQWKKDGAPIPGATSFVYNAPVSQVDDKAKYTCEVTDGVNTDESAPAELTCLQTYNNLADGSGTTPRNITLQPGTYTVSMDGDGVTGIDEGTADIEEID